jgi:hypothetical protein
MSDKTRYETGLLSKYEETKKKGRKGNYLIRGVLGVSESWGMQGLAYARRQLVPMRGTSRVVVVGFR